MAFDIITKIAFSSVEMNVDCGGVATSFVYFSKSHANLDLVSVQRDTVGIDRCYRWLLADNHKLVSNPDPLPL